LIAKTLDKRKATIEIRRVPFHLPVSKNITTATPEKPARHGAPVGTILRPALREGKVPYERG
jgi:hypothetical protein